MAPVSGAAGLTRRSLGVMTAAALAGCAPLLPPLRGGSDPAAIALLNAAAEAHGAAAFPAVHDISVAYEGQWRFLVGSLQPALTDERFRGRSEERLLPHTALFAQSYTGPGGQKFVHRADGAAGSEGDVAVWYNGVPAADAEQRAAAALVADGYALFLLGPLLLTGIWREQRAMVLETAPGKTISADGFDHPCDVLRVALRPGLGFSPADRLALYIDRESRLMRRVRFSLNGLDGTRGAVADVDCADHILAWGLQVPTRFHEGLLRPAPLPVHDWHLVGLDLNRSFAPADLAGPTLQGRAAPPAARLI